MNSVSVMDEALAKLDPEERAEMEMLLALHNQAASAQVIQVDGSLRAPGEADLFGSTRPIIHDPESNRPRKRGKAPSTAQRLLLKQQLKRQQK